MRIAPVSRRLLRGVFLLAALALPSCGTPATAAVSRDSPIDKAAQAQRRPKIYLTVFNNGYARDALPQEGGEFEKLVKAVAFPGSFSGPDVPLFPPAQGAVQRSTAS